ncbi:MAG: hypothetical protein ACXWP4_25770 [Polyangiales bacterium]
MRGAIALCLLLFGCASGCASGAGRPPSKVQGYAVEERYVDPVRMERAPRVLYGGEWARLLDGHWYYPTWGGWVIFREEPTELRRERETIGIEQPPTLGEMPRGPESTQVSPLFAAPVPR